jgi:REP element-mobilizing transposase RayT
MASSICLGGRRRHRPPQTRQSEWRVCVPALRDFPLFWPITMAGARRHRISARAGVVVTAMPICHRYWEPGRLQFITASTYRRAQLFPSPRFRNLFARKLAELREEMHFLIVGWVLMPEHFHLLIRPESADSTPLVVGRLKERAAIRILRPLRDNPQHAWCRKMLGRLSLPSTPRPDS